jgi:hypothetical protein
VGSDAAAQHGSEPQAPQAAAAAAAAAGLGLGLAAAAPAGGPAGLACDPASQFDQLADIMVQAAADAGITLDYERVQQFAEEARAAAGACHG